MRILVTGAAGFIGSHVAEAFAQAGHEVVALDNLSNGRRENLDAELPFEKVDLRDEDTLGRLFKSFRPEVICHHAAQVNVRLSWEDPLDDAQTNILGSLSLLRQSVRWQVKKFLYSSSGGAVYGEPTSLPVREDHAIRPLSNYGVSKYAAELYLQAFHVSSGLQHVVLRYPNVYGPRQDPAGEAGVVAIFATQFLGGIQPRIFGNGGKTRDYVYISDIVDANLRGLDWKGCGVFNLGWGREITDLEVFHTVRDAVGVSVEPVFDEKRPGEIDHICLDASRAGELLGWRPCMEFEEGVKRVVAYWKDRLGKA
jgi:UDP-glucose 4-epimerase